MARTKPIMIAGQIHISLHSVCPRIGLKYCEVYHNMAYWRKPLGIMKRGKCFYINKFLAELFEETTPGYVPFQYRNKRAAIVKADVPHEEILIENTRWVKA